MLFLFDTLRDCYYTVGMVNLYLSLKFCREAFTGNNKVYDPWSNAKKWERTAIMCNPTRRNKQKKALQVSTRHNKRSSTGGRP
jgi:hypothetical protein